MIDFNWDQHRSDTEFALDYLSDYLKMIEGQFEYLREKENLRLSQEDPEGVDREVYRLQFDYNFPSKIRYSFVVLLYIIIETQLIAVCDEISRRRGLDKGNFKRKPLDSAGAYLENVAIVPAKQFTSWEDIKNLQKVRDCVVHTNGQIEDSKESDYLNKLCKRGIGLSVEQGTLMIKEGTLMIEPVYCEKSLEMTKSFFQNLFDSADFGPSINDVVK